MKTTRVTVCWLRGLHLRRAARLVCLARAFRSRIQLRLGNRIADARSILSIMILSANLGASVDIEAIGNDEHEAVRAVEEFFADPDEPDEVTEASELPS